LERLVLQYISASCMVVSTCMIMTCEIRHSG